MTINYGTGSRRMQSNNEQTPRPKVTKTFLLRILSYFAPYWKHMALVFMAVCIVASLSIVPSLLIRMIIDQALPSRDLHLLVVLTLASLAATVVIGLIGIAENFLNTWIATHIIYDLKNTMYKHLEYMSLAFFSVVKPGDIITRMTSDIGGIQDVFKNTFVNLLRNLLIFGVTAAALFAMQWKLALVGMAVIPFFALPTRRVGRMRWKIVANMQKKVQEVNQTIQETLNISGSTLMKIFNRENNEYQKIRDLNQEVSRLQLKEAITGRWFEMALNFFAVVSPMLIYFCGGYLYIKGEISIGSIVAFVALLNKLYLPVVQISNIHVEFTRSLAMFERIFEYFDQQHEIKDRPDAVPLGPVKGRVEFAGVSFAYKPGEPVLADISFVAEPGSMTALVGPSGAGKTTIAYLIPRLYDVGAGCIKLDGRDIRDVTIDSLRANIGMVMQDTYLFNATIRANLLYARQDAGDDELMQACKAANIYDFIAALPEGFETMVGNTGIRLSGGEKQRLSIARVILKDPRVIILDEATSSLDSVSEHLIQSAMEPLLKGRTSFVIAHRLSTVMAADRILVLEYGCILDTGKHEELLARGGLYRTLYERQFDTFNEDSE